MRAAVPAGTHEHERRASMPRDMVRAADAANDASEFDRSPSVRTNRHGGESLCTWQFRRDCDLYLLIASPERCYPRRYARTRVPSEHATGHGACLRAAGTLYLRQEAACSEAAGAETVGVEDATRLERAGRGGDNRGGGGRGRDEPLCSAGGINM